MSVALYRKYRSKSLKEVIGQSHVTDVLEAAIKRDSVGHAYLLTGPRGVGKTSVARILAHEINKLPYANESDHLDIIEIDAASNNGVDHIRDLREKARIAPSLAKYKVYIIDEVHMLSKSAFNALLKILEEPPEHVVFILATTDYHKLPDTIISRTQRFHFKLITESDIASHLKDIAKQEKIKVDDEAIDIIARRGRGSFRDSISLFDQLQSGSSNITADSVNKALGLTPVKTLKQLIESTRNADHTAIISTINKLLDNGVNPSVIADQLTVELRSSLHEHPEMIYALRKLSDVETASHQDIALLIALLPETPSIQAQPTAATSAKPTPQTQAQPAAAAKIVLPEPDVKLTSKTEPTPMPAERPATVQNPVTQVDSEPKNDTEDSAPKKPTETKEPSPTSNGEPGDLNDFDWKHVLERAQDASIGLYAILSSCGYAVTGEGLQIYTGTRFSKLKLEGAKLRPLLSEVVNSVAGGEVEVVLHGVQKPPEDSNLAKVAELMGGGEEVNVS